MAQLQNQLVEQNIGSCNQSNAGSQPVGKSGEDISVDGSIPEEQDTRGFETSHSQNGMGLDGPALRQVRESHSSPTEPSGNASVAPSALVVADQQVTGSYSVQPHPDNCETARATSGANDSDVPAGGGSKATMGNERDQEQDWEDEEKRRTWAQSVAISLTDLTVNRERVYAELVSRVGKQRHRRTAVLRAIRQTETSRRFSGSTRK